MPRTLLALFAITSSLTLLGCESPEAFPYDPDTGKPADTVPAAPAPGQTTPVSAPAPSTDNSALPQLQGEWTLVSLIKDGKTVLAGEARPGKLVITGKRFVLLGAKQIGNMSVGSFSIDPAQKPKAITLVADPRDADGKARFGIYDFLDTPETQGFLRIAIPEPGERKPDNFAPAKNISILVFKRVQTPAK